MKGGGSIDCTQQKNILLIIAVINRTSFLRMSPFECSYSIIEAFGEKVKAFLDSSAVLGTLHNPFYQKGGIERERFKTLYPEVFLCEGKRT